MERKTGMKNIQGVTFIELIIVLVIVAILTSIALPSYQSYVAASRRNEAITTLSRIALYQGQYLTRYNRYANLASVAVSTESEYYKRIIIPKRLLAVINLR